jgi:hypothetical protein
LSPSGDFSVSPTSAVVLSRLDQLMSELALVREGEQPQGKPKQAVPQMRRALVADKGRYRQVQREPNAHDFHGDHHGHLTDGYLWPFQESHDAEACAVCVSALHNLQLARIGWSGCSSAWGVQTKF